METAEIVSKLNQITPGAVLQKIRFGKSERACIWIEAESLSKTAKALKSLPNLGLDWLENLSVCQIDEALVFSYFLRSNQNNETLVVRATAPLKTPKDRVRVPTVRDTWPMAAAMEAENGELFGIDFITSGGEIISNPPEKLPKDWVGYPLRNSYAFPQEVYGILHSRSPEMEGNLDA